MEPDKKINTNDTMVDIRGTLPVPDKTKQMETEASLKKRTEMIEKMQEQNYLTPQKTEAEKFIEDAIKLERQRVGTANTRDYATIQFTPKQMSYLISLLQSQPNLNVLPVIEECLVKLESARIRV